MVRRLRGSGLGAEFVVFRVGHDGVVWVAARHGGAEPVQSARLVVHRIGARKSTCTRFLAVLGSCKAAPRGAEGRWGTLQATRLRGGRIRWT